MAASVWKGMISFGLVSVPIRLFAAARPKRTVLHQIHSECKTRRNRSIAPRANEWLTAPK